VTTTPLHTTYFIGSAHYVKGPKTGRYYEIDWREEDLRACIDNDFDGDGLAVTEAYFANVAKVAEKKPTILGHFDLIKKINDNNKFFDESDPRYTAAATSALMAAARNRCVLEVNTSAAYRGFRKDYFPSDAILKEWLVLSGNVVLTADAHDTKALTFGFDRSRRPPERPWLHPRCKCWARTALPPASCKILCNEKSPGCAEMK